MFVAVFCFLKDSSDVSQLLLDDFRACQGYLFLSEFLLKWAFLANTFTYLVNCMVDNIIAALRQGHSLPLIICD